MDVGGAEQAGPGPTGARPTGCERRRPCHERSGAALVCVAVFQLPLAFERLLLAGDGAVLRGMLRQGGLPDDGDALAWLGFSDD